MQNTKQRPAAYRRQNVKKAKSLWLIRLGTLVGITAVLVLLLVGFWGIGRVAQDLFDQAAGRENLSSIGAAGHDRDAIQVPGLPHNPYSGDTPLKEVPVFLQNPELPVGCEATAGAMLLAAYGYDVDKIVFACALPKSSFEQDQGNLYAAHPDQAFIGDPFSSGYGAFAPVVAQTMQALIDSAGGKHRAKDITGSSEAEILQHIDRGIPVCIWGTMELRPVAYRRGWYLQQNGHHTDDYFNWPGNEHCMVLTAYDSTSVTVNDPMFGQTTYDRQTFFQRYNDMGQYAIILEANM